MMKKFLKLLGSSIAVVLLIMSLLLTTGCDSDVNPEGATVKMEMKAVTMLSTLNSTARVKNTGLVFQQVMIGLVELEFETFEENESEDEAGEESDEEIEFEGAFAVDLITGTSTPDLGIAELTPGLYEEIEMELGPVLGDGNSVFISFDVPQDGADPVRIEYSSEEEFEFELEDEINGYQIDDNALNAFIVNLDLDALFAGLDFGTAEADLDGVIRINETSNSGLAGQIKDNLNGSFDSEEDEEEDEDD